jgi:hypothetical protein
LPASLAPAGTGLVFYDGGECLRYVDVLTTADGYTATWQQSRPDGSQPLMINRVANKK